MSTLEKYLDEVVEDVKAERDTLLAQNRELREALKLSQTCLELAMSSTKNDIARSTYQTAYAAGHIILAKLGKV